MADLVLELYSEELPLSAQSLANSEFSAFFSSSFKKADLPFESVNVFTGPCRITLYVDGLPLVLEQKSQMVKGPKISTSSKALEGFCKKHSVKAEQLVQIEEYYFYEEKASSKDVSAVLSALLPRILSNISWPQSMAWGKYNLSWPRPLRKIFCLFDSKVLSFSYHHLEADCITFGHKFLSRESASQPQKSLTVNSWEEYLLALERNKVVLCHKERVKSISKQALKLLEQRKLLQSISAGLLEEVASLVEWPVAALGEIDISYMSMPEEVIVTVMQVHQKYFPTYDAITGQLAPYFLFVANCDVTEEILSDNESVLKARLADAMFLYKKDLSVSMEQKYAQLFRISFHPQLGSILDKCSRLEALAESIVCKDAHLLKLAAKFCKCDLAGELVNDLPNLQGCIGYHQALAENYPQAVALAIKEHYLPLGARDSLPESDLGRYLSLIDKLDSLVGIYFAGERMTGNKDPFGLRRLAVGIIRILESSKALSDEFINDLLKKAIELYGAHNSNQLFDEILQFIKTRHKHLLKHEFSYRAVDAVIDFSGYEIHSALSKVRAVDAFLTCKEFNHVTSAFKRTHNILGVDQAFLDFSKKDLQIPKDSFLSCDLLTKALLNNQLWKTQPSYANEIFSALKEYDRYISDPDFYTRLINLSQLASKVSVFLDNVMVANNTIAVLLLSAALERFNYSLIFARLVF